MKSADIGPLPPFTRITVGGSDPQRAYPPLKYDRASGTLSRDFKVDLAALHAFIDGRRRGWTRAIAVGFGPPAPASYAHLYAGNEYLGYFAVGSGALPGSAAFFQVQLGDLFAQKRITAAEANQFLELIGEGGELAENVDTEVRQQMATRSSASRKPALVERPAKFQPGDRVRVNVTGAEGTVCLRTKFFRQNRYFITLPGSHYVFETVADRTQRERWKAEGAARMREWARSQGMAESAFDFPEYQPRPSHEEGPFYESDLELVR